MLREELFRFCKDVLFYVTATPLQSITYLGLLYLSMIVPGYAGSEFISKKAKLVLDEIWMYRYGISSRDRTRSILMNRIYTEHIDPSLKNKLLELAGDPYDSQAIERIENIFTFTKPNKEFHLSQGEAFVSTLRANQYCETTIRQLYDYFTARIVMLKYDIQLPIKPPFLKGPPGTGKTRIASLIAESFDIPLLKVNWNQAADEMFCVNSSFMIMMRNIQSFHFLILFDEMDKSECTNSCEIFNMLNNETFIARGLGNMNFPTHRVFVLCAGNELPKAQEIKNPNVADALLDRFNVIEFEQFSPEKKRFICQTYINEYCERFGLDPAKIQVETNQGGLRETLHRTGMEIVRHLRIRDGWNHIA